MDGFNACSLVQLKLFNSILKSCYCEKLMLSEQKNLTLRKTKQSRKWKISLTLLERRTLGFSSYV